MTRAEKVDACARAAHEANRAYSSAHGDHSHAPWETAPDWQRASARSGVEGVLRGNGPRQSHEAWMAEKLATGWTYGAIKDPGAKTHPCLLAYDALPDVQRRKDGIFISVVEGMALALELELELELE